MKIFKAALKYTAIAYLIGSLAFSIAATAFHQTSEGSLIERRVPFTVCEFFTSTVIGTDEQGNTFGEADGGGRIGFGRSELAEGTRVLTLCVYNPFTTWFDDIVARFDLLTFESPA